MPLLYHPHGNERPRQRMDERQKRPYVIGQLLALVAQRLNLGRGRRIGDRESGDFAVSINQRDGDQIVFEKITKIVEEILSLPPRFPVST